MEQIEHVLSLVRKKRPILNAVLDQYGNLVLEDYVKTFRYHTSETIQPYDEVITVSVAIAKSMLGEDVAKKLKQTLTRSQDMLTSDHFGPINLSLTTQGDILYSFSKRTDEVVPVFAFGDVPLNNFNYSRGFILARGIKTNIYPSSQSTVLVTVAPVVTQSLVEKAQQQIQEQYTTQQISEKEYRAQEIMLSVYKKYTPNPTIQYQFTKINSELWKHMFDAQTNKSVPEIVFLEMETIVTKLLIHDFLDKSSAMSHLFFNKGLRANLLKSLDTCYGCWDLQKLDQLMQESPETWDKTQREEKAQQRRKIMAGCGTVFFWGIDTKGRRVALRLNESQTYLEGKDDGGGILSVTFTPEDISRALEQKLIVPSLFTSFTSIAFLRGFKCYGGFMQTDYLTSMKQGLLYALKKSINISPQYGQWAKKIANVPTENYVTGMTFVLARFTDTQELVSAGGVEIIAHGGLSASEIDRIKQITVSQANLLGALKVYPVVYREEERNIDITSITLRHMYEQLKEAFVMISL